MTPNVLGKAKVSVVASSPPELSPRSTRRVLSAGRVSPVIPGGQHAPLQSPCSPQPCFALLCSLTAPQPVATP